eukprot:gene5657-6353_t
MILVHVTNSLDQETLIKLRSLLEENPLLGWLDRDSYRSLEDLGFSKRSLSYKEVNRSLLFVNPHPTRMKTLVYKALKGNNINMAVLGGSISAGATLYKSKNYDKIYFKVFADWWNKMIGSITKSNITYKSYAIGATGSDFFAYCLKNYVSPNDTDLIIWELAANDYHRFDNRDVPPTMPLELLMRNMLRLKSSPAIIGANFFRGQDFIKEGGCNNLEGDGADYILRYYDVPAVSWSKLICRKLIASGSEGFRKVFASDDSHPNVLGHAQIGFLLIEYFRRLFKDVILELIIPGEATLVPSNQVFLPTEEISSVLKPTLYVKSALVAPSPLCYTFNVASDGEMPKNSMKIRVIRNDGYAIAVAHGFLVRKDKTRGLRTKAQGHELHLLIDVPVQLGENLSDWMVLVGTYSNLGGAVFFLNGQLSRVIETQKYAYGSIVAAVATHVPPGKHLMVIKSLSKGFFLSSLMLG